MTPPRHELIAATITGAFTFGMVLALLGSIKPALAKRLEIDEARVGSLLSVFFLALMPSVLLSGILIDLVHVEWVLMLGSLLLSAAIFGLALGRSRAHFLTALLATGAAGSCLSAGSSVLMPRAFFPDNAAASNNLGNVFFGLGALVTPALVAALLRFLGYRRAVSLVALLCLVPAVAVAFTNSEAFQLPAGPRASLSEVLGSPIVWLSALVLFLYCPLEGTVGTWAASYLAHLGLRERRAPLLLAGFWLAFLASRLLAAFLQHRSILPRHSEVWFICALGLLVAITLGNLASTPRLPSAVSGLLLLGLLLGPIFPTLVGFLFNHFAPSRHGTAFGAMFGLGISGNLVLPPLMSAYARRVSVQRSLRLPMVVAILLAVASLLVGLLP